MHSPHSLTIARMGQDDLTILGNRIREKRKSLGLTQEELAAIAEIDRSYIGGVERGERNVTFTMLGGICVALQCDIAALTHELPKTT